MVKRMPVRVMQRIVMMLQVMLESVDQKIVISTPVLNKMANVNDRDFLLHLSAYFGAKVAMQRNRRLDFSNVLWYFLSKNDKSGLALTGAILKNLSAFYRHYFFSQTTILY